MQTRTQLLIGGVVLFLGAIVVVWQLGKEPGAQDRQSSRFWESAHEAGIKFPMRFLPEEQGEKFKINLYDHGSGLAVGDYDGDGHEDVYFCNQLGPNALYRNRGDGTFTDVTEQAGVGLGDRVCVAATFADYDNDGRADLFVTSTRGGNVLFRNRGDGSFQDVTQQAGLTHVGHSQSALFADFDNDGLLDLFLTNTAQWTTDTFDSKTRSFVGKGNNLLGAVQYSPKEFNIYYRNNGNGTFTDVTQKAGLRGLGWAGDAVAFDYNEDGKLDLFVGNMFGPCQLYQNQGEGKFANVTWKALGRTPFGAVGTSVLDFNNDGRLDLYVVDMHSDMWMGLDHEGTTRDDAVKWEKHRFNYASGQAAETNAEVAASERASSARIGFRMEEVLYGNALFRNDGDGKFTEISPAAGTETFWPWSIAASDFDNDGWEDLFVASGMGYPFYYWPNYLLMNQGDSTFVNQAGAAGIEPPHAGIYLPKRIGDRRATRSSRSAVTADFDGDGRLDLMVNNFNDTPYYFRNQFPKRNYVALQLRGRKSNRDAVGAVVRLHQGGRTMTRQVRAANGYLAHSSRVIHFGLGAESQVERVEIIWPSGVRQTLDQVSVNAFQMVDEPAP